MIDPLRLPPIYLPFTSYLPPVCPSMIPQVWLIEVNNNPCLMTPGDATAEILPTLIEDTFKLCVDPLYPETGDPLYKRTPKVAETRYTKLAIGTFTGDRRRLISRYKPFYKPF